ncbi:MAG: FKBP-type peptidyl-prolyl cis-trans isomerase [Clostridia bacterium]|nr:FKBP-type peptidyl-prolyl cis-trans isomerase [Clostridia bacterium]
MKKSTIITIICFALGIIVLAVGFILLTDNNISNSLFPTTTTTTTGGGKPDPELKPMDFFKTDLSDYITLGKYEGIELEVEMIAVDDEYLANQIDRLLISSGKYTKLFEGTVTEGAVFNFNYVGYLDGVPFEGGNSAGTEAYISDDIFYLTSGSTFIEGFAEGMLGAKVGEWFSINATFPAEYGEATLAGKTVVFDVKVNYIAKADALTDAIAKEISKNAYETADEFKQYLKDSVNSSIKNTNIADLWGEILKTSTITIPQQQFDYLYGTYKSQIEYYASMMSYTYENFLKDGGAPYFFGIEVYSDAELVEYVNEKIKLELVLAAITKAEGIQITDAEYNAFVEEIAAEEGKTAAEIITKYGDETLRNEALMSKTEKFVEENNSFVLKTEDAE